MTASQSLKIYDVLLRHFKNEEDANVVVQEIEQIVAERFEAKEKDFSTRSEVGLLRKDLENIRFGFRSQIETTSLRVESNLKSEINKLIVWIVATMFASGVLFIALGKIFFDK